MSMKIIELSTYNSKEVLSNSEYTSTFPPVLISNGTQIQISQAFIDSVISGNYQNISIETDTDLHFQFGIYYMNLDEADKHNNGLITDIYVCRNSTSLALYTDIAKITIEKGNYTPIELANVITKKMTIIPHITNLLDVSIVPGSLLKTTETTYTFPCLTGSSDTVPPNERYFGQPISELHASIIPVSDLIYPNFTVGDDIYITYAVSGYAPVRITTQLLSFNQQTGLLTFTPHATGANQFTYPTSFSSDNQYYSVSISSVNTIHATFYNQTNNADSFYFNKPVYMGTSQFALEFDENSGKFQFTQIHMPMFSSGANPLQGVSVVESLITSGVYLPADVRSGIFFVDLQPSDFWSSLGFNLNTLLVQDNNTHVLKTPLARGTNITSHLFGYDGFIAHSYPYPMPSASLYFYATDTVISIEADEQLPNGDSGYYLIELVGLKTDYLNDNGQQFGSIMNVASKNYNASGFITVYSDGSITYVNNGEPYMLSSLRVRILDPITKTPITTLGTKNSVFIQIT